MLYRNLQRAISTIGDRQFEGIAATSDLQADGIALDMAGADLSRFKNGAGPLLLAHDSKCIIGRIEWVRTTSTTMLFGATFASAGISPKADEVCGLLKDGVLNGVSLGFNVDEAEPIDQTWPRGGGMRATRWTAYEISLVAVPMDFAAAVTARAAAFPAATSSPRQPVWTGDTARWAADMRRYLEQRALAANGGGRR